MYLTYLIMMIKNQFNINGQITPVKHKLMQVHKYMADIRSSCVFALNEMRFVGICFLQQQKTNFITAEQARKRRVIEIGRYVWGKSKKIIV